MTARQSKIIIWKETKGEDISKSFRWYGCIDEEFVVGIAFGDGEFLGNFINQKLKFLPGLDDVISSPSLEGIKKQLQDMLQKTIDEVENIINALEFISEEKE